MNKYKKFNTFNTLTKNEWFDLVINEELSKDHIIQRKL